MSSNYNNNVPSIRKLDDPLTDSKVTYVYKTRDAKEERLYQAMLMALNDECPPNRKDYLCLSSEDNNTDEETCTKCIQRWATKSFGVEQK